MMAKSLPERSVIDMEEAQDIRSLREARGLSLDDVLKATRISLRNLEAIEAGTFYLLPPPIYTRAYFKSYAHLLGVDEKLIAGAYEKSLTISARALEEEIEEIPEGSSFFSKKFIVNISVIFVLFVLGFFTYIHLNSPVAGIAPDSKLTVDSTGKPVKDVTDAAIAVQPAGVIPPDSGNRGEGPSAQALGIPAAVRSEETTTALKMPVDKPTLIIVAREKTWLRIAEDQKDAYELFMAPGDRVERSALQYAIDVGNAGGISVQFQGNSMNTLGKSGEVVHLRLP